jgi:hypothetical protein
MPVTPLFFIGERATKPGPTPDSLVAKVKVKGFH